VIKTTVPGRYANKARMSCNRSSALAGCQSSALWFVIIVGSPPTIFLSLTHNCNGSKIGPTPSAGVSSGEKHPVCTAWIRLHTLRAADSICCHVWPISITFTYLSSAPGRFDLLSCLANFIHLYMSAFYAQPIRSVVMFGRFQSPLHVCLLRPADSSCCHVWPISVTYTCLPSSPGRFDLLSCLADLSHRFLCCP
jgi:hypothetical protein